MPATFHPALDRDLDVARFHLGDTEMDSPLVQDEMILALIGQGAHPIRAAAQLAEHLAARFASKVTSTVDGQGKSYSHLQQHYSDLAGRLGAAADRAEAEARTNEIVSARVAEGGGISVMGATAGEVWEARWDLDRAENADLWA